MKHPENSPAAGADDLPARFKALRLAMGLSVADMATRLGLQGADRADNLRQIERGARAPSGPLAVLLGYMEKEQAAWENSVHSDSDQVAHSAPHQAKTKRAAVPKSEGPQDLGPNAPQWSPPQDSGWLTLTSAGRHFVNRFTADHVAPSFLPEEFWIDTAEVSANTRASGEDYFLEVPAKHSRDGQPKIARLDRCLFMRVSTPPQDLTQPAPESKGPQDPGFSGLKPAA